jgi:hypothetical protein
MGITKAMYDCLDTVAWAMEHFGSLHTNRQVSRAVMQRCVEAGLCRSVGRTIPCDADGSLLFHRKEREGFALTDAGRLALDAWYAEKGYVYGRKRLLADVLRRAEEWRE